MNICKITKKGQITIPLQYRREFELDIGSIVTIKNFGRKLVIEKPMKDIMELKGKWRDVDEKIFRDMRKHWGSWNEKGVVRY